MTPHLELVLTIDRSEVSRARRAVARALADLGHPELIDDATLIVSELVTNALHETETRLNDHPRELIAAARVRFRIHENDGRPAIEVWDMFPDEIPQTQNVDVTRESGRGLLIVSQLAKEWGYVLRSDGGRTWKSVWAVLK